MPGTQAETDYVTLAGPFDVIECFVEWMEMEHGGRQEWPELWVVREEMKVERDPVVDDHVKAVRNLACMLREEVQRAK